MKREYEVLIVDDVKGSAESFAALIKAKCNIEAISATTPDEALNYIKSNPIKVVVLDQRMPLMNGTELYKEMLLINPTIRAIMLTGLADREEVSLALKLGYDDHIEKSNISKLPEVVYQSYVRYEVNLAEKIKIQKDNILFKEKTWFFSRHTKSYSIISIQKVNDRFLFDTKWEAFLDLYSGQTLDKIDDVLLEESVEVTEEVEQKLKTDLNLTNKQIIFLKIKLSNEFSQTNTFSITNKKASRKSSKLTYSLAAQSADLSLDYVARRVIEKNPVYEEFSAILYCACSCCKKNHTSPISFFKQTTKMAIRQIDYLKSGLKQITDMGISQYS